MLVFSTYPDDPRVYREAETLSSKGIVVDIFCLRKPGQPTFESSKNIRVYRLLSSGKGKLSLIKYFYYSSLFLGKALFKLTIFYRKVSYNLIQIHNMPDHLVFSSIIPKFFKVPIILDMHDLTPELYASRTNNPLSFIFILIVKFIERISCMFSTHIITTSYGFRDSLMKRGISSKKVTLIFNGPDTLIFKPGPPRNFIKLKNPRFLYHGTVSHRFGLHIAIEACKNFKLRFPEFQFNIYGNYDESYKDYLLQKINEYKLKNNIYLNGYVNIYDIPNIIHNSDFGVVPYLSDQFMDLALSTKTFEYVILKLPVIASKLPSTYTIFDDQTLHYFESGNSLMLSDLMIKLCENPQILEQFVINAYHIGQRYSWNHIGEKYYQLISNYL